MSWLDDLIARVFQQSNGGPETPPSELWAALCAMDWPSWWTLGEFALKNLLVAGVFVSLLCWLPKQDGGLR